MYFVMEIGVAIGAGRQSVVAFVNIGCYYIVGVPIGALLGYVAQMEVKVRKQSYQNYIYLDRLSSTSTNI